MVKCQFCEKNFKRKRSRNGHLSNCIKGPHREKTRLAWKNRQPRPPRIPDRICRFCKESFPNNHIRSGHSRFCKSNPNREKSALIDENGKPRYTHWMISYGPDHPKVLARHKKMGKTQKEKYKKDPTDLLNRFSKKTRAFPKTRISKPEYRALVWLQQSNLKFKHNEPLSTYIPDFTIGNLIIEIDGAYWHDKKRDAIRDKKLNSMGYYVVRIDSKEKIEKRLQEILFPIKGVEWQQIPMRKD